MNEDIRRNLSELLARYQLEPELADVYVEGVFDREVLACAFRSGSPCTTFYEIDTVDVPDDTLRKHGFSPGMKQRVIALSRELAELPDESRVLCLVDRDLDHWFGALEESRRLRWTIFCSIEAHFLTLPIANDVLVITGRARITNMELFFDSLGQTLRDLYCLRLADREHQFALKWVALKKYLSSGQDSIGFDLGRYIDAVLNANAKMSHRKAFLRSVKSWRQRLDCDLRSAFRGHDYVDLLAWAITEFNGHREFASPVAVERLFVLLSRTLATISEELQ